MEIFPPIPTWSTAGDESGENQRFRSACLFGPGKVSHQVGFNQSSRGSMEESDVLVLETGEVATAGKTLHI
jgi:hypothetical protein